MSAGAMTATKDLTLRPNELSLLTRLPHGQFLAGAWSASRSEQAFDVHDPSTGGLLASVDAAGPGDVDAALTAAASTQEAFASTTPRYRGDLLARAAAALLDQEDDFALLITLETGKPLTEAHAEVRYAAEFLRWFAEEAPRSGGEQRLTPDGTSRMLLLSRPVGPCLLITPRNFPIAMAARKVAPAIAAGCTSVVKPAEETPLTTLLFAALLQDVGVPAGVVNVLTTDRPGPLVSRLLADGRLRKLSFTGSTAVGKLLLRQAGDSVVRTSMELGGNAPFVVFEDANLPEAVQGFLIAKLRNGGQACTAANRLFVHRDVELEFVRALERELQNVRMGRGTLSSTTLGPMIDSPALDRMRTWVTEALDTGARLLIQGPEPPGSGQFMSPLVLADVPQAARLASEEIFGPIIGLSVFDSESEVVQQANATAYGLVAYVFSRDLPRIMRLLPRLEFGMVGINRGIVSNAAAPFGGIKQSGLGREGSREGLHEYQDVVYAAFNT